MPDCSCRSCSWHCCATIPRHPASPHPPLHRRTASPHPSPPRLPTSPPQLYSQSGLEGERRVLIDPNTLSEDGTVALGGQAFSEDGTLYGEGRGRGGEGGDATWCVSVCYAEP